MDAPGLCSCSESPHLSRFTARGQAAFSWEGLHGRAYEHLVYALCLRAARMEGSPVQACYHLRPPTLPRVQVTRGGERGWVGT